MAQEVHVARQAIYDWVNRPCGYELLFRALPKATGSSRNDELALRLSVPSTESDCLQPDRAEPSACCRSGAHPYRPGR